MPAAARNSPRVPASARNVPSNVEVTVFVPGPARLAGVPVPGGELYQRPGRAVAVIPTNDELTMNYLAQLDDRRPGQAVPDRLRPPVTCPHFPGSTCRERYSTHPASCNSIPGTRDVNGRPLNS